MSIRKALRVLWMAYFFAQATVKMKICMPHNLHPQQHEAHKSKEYVLMTIDNTKTCPKTYY